jgi:transposase
MQLKTILNRVEPFKSFVYSKVEMTDAAGLPQIKITIEPRVNGRPICSGCGQPGPGYDCQPHAREFEYVPLWAISVFFLYRMRRVNCATCGVKTEQVPWADGKCHLTTTYRWFLARWAKRLSWKEVASAFHTTWGNVFRAVQHAVQWGLVHRDESGITAIGVDEIQWSRGHKYLTLVYQIDEGRKRLLWVVGVSLGASKPATRGRFKCRQGVKVDNRYRR